MKSFVRVLRERGRTQVSATASQRQSVELQATDSSIKKVRAHYERYLGMFNREQSYEAGGFRQRPPIVNLGYWARGARTAREAQEHLVLELCKRAQDLRGRRVLDVGCGLAGPATILAQDYGASVDGVNIVPIQLTWARHFVSANELTNKIRLYLASAMNLPFRDALFDVVFCLEAAHCFADKDGFLREALRVLRPGGILVLADITASSRLPIITWQPALGLHLVRAQDWRRMTESVGFIVDETQMIGGAVYPGCRSWVKQTARERRRQIYEKSCESKPSWVRRRILRLRAWVLELVYCRSILLTLSRFRLRNYVLIAAHKPE